PTRWGSFTLVAQPALTQNMQGIVMGAQPDYAPPGMGDGPRAWLLAWDPARRRAARRATEGSGSHGVLGPAGSLVYQGNGTSVLAFRADTGDKLWSTELGANMAAGFITYAIDGVQYLAGAGGIGRNQGRRVFVLKLGGKSEVPPPPPPVQQVLNPPDRFGTAAALAHGRAKYQELCTICHEARRNVGGFPDLRYSPYLNSDAA